MECVDSIALLGSLGHSTQLWKSDCISQKSTRFAGPSLEATIVSVVSMYKKYGRIFPRESGPKCSTVHYSSHQLPLHYTRVTMGTSKKVRPIPIIYHMRLTRGVSVAKHLPKLL